MAINGSTHPMPIEVTFIATLVTKDRNHQLWYDYSNAFSTVCYNKLFVKATCW